MSIMFIAVLASVLFQVGIFWTSYHVISDLQRHVSLGDIQGITQNFTLIIATFIAGVANIVLLMSLVYTFIIYFVIVVSFMVIVVVAWSM
ncbi:hypothetical protein [Listeria phage P100plus]|uniref:Uncharacterized protein n=6 Tax=Pecentumvirus TaxID=1857844 RepID=A0A6H2A7Y3_9CAUD|nr:hypothetical protein AG2_061 [Listeria phage vB_LmoM_AG20]YP_406550.1 gp174 [Listeria phage P100]AII27355.1 hypothetical protein [Listeria phage LMTA-34]QIG60818.1 hypothetical protein vBLinoVEfB7_075 [Listeria phage vB_Lino_VEfB7]QIG61005.1 hypothetical protein vBLivaVAfA18_081 [Listeria phage vB_Liva_VAfA18]QJB22446.1 hypothetical protein [Listeria phage P100plus]QJB22636.1 hypothetical protein [Listeria phage P200]QKN84273.1 hypothetical protein [Listeria virus P61]WIW77299.1 putative